MDVDGEKLLVERVAIDPRNVVGALVKAEAGGERSAESCLGTGPGYVLPGTQSPGVVGEEIAAVAPGVSDGGIRRDAQGGGPCRRDHLHLGLAGQAQGSFQAGQGALQGQAGPC